MCKTITDSHDAAILACRQNVDLCGGLLTTISLDEGHGYWWKWRIDYKKDRVAIVSENTYGTEEAAARGAVASLRHIFNALGVRYAEPHERANDEN